MNTTVAPIAAVLALVLGTAAPAAAQTATGQITGTITDATGAAVTGVRIKITNTLTGLTRETTSSDRGTYSVPQLPVGTYVITAEKDGLQARRLLRQRAQGRSGASGRHDDGARRAHRERGSARAVGRARQRDRQHRPGHHREAGHRAAPERPELPAAVVPRQRRRRDDRRAGRRCGRAQATRSASTGLGRRPTTTCSMARPTRIPRSARRPRSCPWTRFRSSRNRPPPTRPSTGFSANQISIVSKTGTNRLSGSVFYFLRNDALDARSFFDVEKQKLDQKQFGFVTGGPVLVPGAYDGRNQHVLPREL